MIVMCPAIDFTCKTKATVSRFRQRQIFRPQSIKLRTDYYDYYYYLLEI
jgi:hypothetical protein